MLDNINNSKILKCFDDFVKGYVSIHTPSFKEDTRYLMRLSCVNDDKVSIRVSGRASSVTEWSMGYVTEDPNIRDIVIFYGNKGIGIDDFAVQMYESKIHYISVNKVIQYNSLIDGSYILNNETGKLVLTFDKSDYSSLPEELKKLVKSNFLFSCQTSSWVSRAKFPNLFSPKLAVEKLGLVNKGTINDTISFSEQMERKANRAEVRAARYDEKAQKAEDRGNALQKPIKDMHGDIAFFTQPNINTASGKAFTNQRQRMFDAYFKGFNEFKKSEYYADKAEAARATALGTKPTDKGFIDRRLREVDKTIRAQRKNIESYKASLEKIDSGKVLRRYNGDIISRQDILDWIENAELIIDQAISKSVYYHECLDELGGVQYSQDNIKRGYIVKLHKWGKCRVASTGPKNIKYVIMEGGAKGYGGVASYADIEDILSEDISGISDIKHPFEVGDKFIVDEWVSSRDGNKEVVYTVVKTTDDRVTLQSDNGKKVVRKPKRRYADRRMEIWTFDSFVGSIEKIRYFWCEGLSFEDWEAKYDSDMLIISSLHGECHKWVIRNYSKGDECIIISQYEPEVGKVCLLHCCLRRDGYYLDVRGGTKNFDDVLDAFDYGEYNVDTYNTLDDFKAKLIQLGIL